MSTPDASIECPVVSVIVPARNEEASLEACLQSLVSQEGIRFEVIVINDGSTDRTRQIAMSFPIRVGDARALPWGWTGKNNAIATGARHARGEWLLFTDADTVHLPGSLARSVAEAQQQGAALLSYSPEQEVEGFWEQAVMPVVFAELATTYRPAQVSDPASPAAAANGQYLLITREAYDAVGGHGVVAGSLLEDVALARLVKASGRKIFFRYGGDTVRTRMYRSFAQLREGWTKNLVLLFTHPARLALLRLLEFLLILASLQVATLEALYRRTAPAILAATVFLILCSQFVTRIRKAHFASGATTLSFLGLPVFSYLLLRSRFSYRGGEVSWKGRVYEPSRVPAAEPGGSDELTEQLPEPKRLAAKNH